MSNSQQAFLAEFSQELEEIYQKQPAFTERPYRAHGSHVMVGVTDETVEPTPRTPERAPATQPQPAGV